MKDAAKWLKEKLFLSHETPADEPEDQREPPRPLDTEIVMPDIYDDDLAVTVPNLESPAKPGDKATGFDLYDTVAMHKK